MRSINGDSLVLKTSSHRRFDVLCLIDLRILPAIRLDKCLVVFILYVWEGC